MALINTVPVQFDKTTGEFVLTTFGLATTAINGYQHIQSTPATSWLINHGRESNAAIVQVYINDQMVIPTQINILDLNNIEIDFGAASEQGVANIIFVA